MTVHPEQARAAFERNFEKGTEVGASVSVWQNSREILSLGQGFRDRESSQPWTTRTPVLVWSATKGPASACLLHALEREQLPLEMDAREFWPELHAPASFGQILSHAAGLPALDEKVSAFDHDEVARALAAQRPAWPAGERHGYHPRTFGYLLDELVRRISGEPLADYWRRHFGGPLLLDFWMGVPENGLDQVATIMAVRAGQPAPADDFSRAFMEPHSLTGRSFASPSGPGSVAAMNSAEVRRHSFPAFGGISTARALAKFYAMLAAGGEWESAGYFSRESLRVMETVMRQGRDQVLLMPTAFSAGFMKDPTAESGQKIRQSFGPSLRAFGQPGAGGSLAFADPENGIGFAYVMNQMGAGVLPNARATGIVRALYGLD